MIHSRLALPRAALTLAVIALMVALVGVATSASPATAAPETHPATVAEGTYAAGPGLGDPLFPPGEDVQQPPSEPDRGEDQRPSPPAEPEPAPWPVLLAQGLLVLLSLALAGVALTTLWWMLHAWRTDGSLGATRFPVTPSTTKRSFSLLLPARHEEQVLGHTIDRLAASDHPEVEIIVIVGHDDPGTEAVARAAADRHPDLVRVVVDESMPKNKPRAMNTALPYVRGDVVGVFDAEDEVDPSLLRLVDARFEQTDADVVQGGVQLMNIHSNWWAVRNCLEYYFWFRSRLHFHAQARFIPLGGNTVFVRTELLREAGGWDGDCLAEDCELGVRLSVAGAHVAVAYDPDVVTREETPGSLKALFKQRTRWSQGFLQVYRKGVWRELPTLRQRSLARYTLAMPFLQAFTGLMIPVSVILMLTAKVPVVVAMVTFIPVVPTLVTLAVEIAGLGEFARSYGVRARIVDYVRLVLGTFPYQVVLAAAALRAVWREMRGDASWEKTEHVGAHVTAAPDAGRPAEAPSRPSDRKERHDLPA